MNLIKSISPSEKWEHKYGSLLTNHVRIILESGLLLDEDYEVLLKATNFKIYSNRGFSLPVGLIVCGVATVASVIVARRYNQSLILLPPVGLTITKFYLDVKKGLREKRRNEATSLTIQSLVRVKRLNKSIVQYLKIRSDLNSKQKESLILNNKNVEDFVKHLIENSIELLYYVLNELNFLSRLTENLTGDFQGIKELNVSGILQSNNHLQPESVALKVDDLYALLTSKFLNYLGLNFCKLLNDFNSREMACLLDETLPRLIQQLNHFRQNVEADFNNLRYCVIQKQQITCEKPLKKHISGKLRQTLLGSVNNLALIMEKSQELLQKVEKLDETKNMKEFESSLTDLRNHALATYESLDVLCRLYGILSKDTSSPGLVHAPSNLSKHQTTSANVNFDDVLEPLEENYELYLDQTEDVSTEDKHNVYEDQSATYLGLMIKELRQSLQQHDRFLEAKSKRGIQDEDQTVARTMRDEPKQLPKFDLSTVNCSKIVEKNCDDDNKPIAHLPVPPPPPLPLFEVNVEEVRTKTGLLRSIKILSDQMGRQEETFGTSGSDESCNSD